MSENNADQERSRSMNKYCLPIFTGKDFVLDGRPPSNPSATATLVKFQDRLWVVTCDHVRKALEAKKGYGAHLSVDRLVIELGYYSETGKISVLRQVNVDGKSIDISIAEIPNHYLALLSKNKEKSAIDLDKFEHPNWDNIEYCIATGFPDKMKTVDGDLSSLQSPMVEVIVGLPDKSEKTSPFVTLFSELDKPSGYGLSGISGGPIFALTPQGSVVPVGITIEGHPSGEDSVSENGQSFMGAQDLFVRGLRLTPEIFAKWVDASA